MKLEELDAIIFDFGGVLINIDYEATIDAFKEMGIDDFQQLYSQASQSNLFNDLETGTISADTFITEIQRYLPSHISRQKIIDAWNTMINDVPEEVIAFIKWVKEEKGKKIYLLSNTNIIHIDVALQAWKKVSNHSPRDIFDNVYLSHEVGQRKPNASIFQFVCDKESLDPPRTLFIDDSIQHIEGASSIGLQTCHLKKQTDLYEIFS